MSDTQLNLLLAKMKKFSVQTCQNVPFCELTTLGVGGTIKLVIYPDTVRKYLRTLKAVAGLNINYLIIGKGSNILASDSEFDGAVISTVKMCGIKVRGRKVKAFAGTSTVTLSAVLKEKGLSGGEFFACLPASVGGAVVGNAGCYGQDVAGVLQKVKVWRNGKVKTIKAKNCAFSKRSSIFKSGNGHAIVSATFKFERSSTQAVSEKIAEMRKKKAQSQPLNYRSAGCVLYHDKAIVSKLIDDAGLKGYTVGGAQVSVKHAGFVVNLGNATGADVYAVVRHMRRTLSAKYGVNAQTEVCLINFNEDEK